MDGWSLGWDICVYVREMGVVFLSRVDQSISPSTRPTHSQHSNNSGPPNLIKRKLDGKSLEAFGLFKKGVKPEWEDPVNVQVRVCARGGGFGFVVCGLGVFVVSLGW